jgi:hypothetical protein
LRGAARCNDHGAVMGESQFNVYFRQLFTFRIYRGCIIAGAFFILNHDICIAVI